MSTNPATSAAYPFGDYVEPEGPPERTAGRWREAPGSNNKFQLVKFLPLPGKCASCGYSGGQDNLSTDYERMFIDLNFDVDYYGVVGFCTDCVIQMGSVLGFVPPEKYEQVLIDLSTEISRSQELGLANDQLRGIVHTLTDVDRTPHFLVRAEPETEQGTDDDVATAESDADELNNLKRRFNIPSDSSGSNDNTGLNI